MTIQKYLAFLFCFSIPLVCAPDKVVPEGYVVQLLDPFGGEIIRPQDWYYDVHRTAEGFTFILSKEPSDGNNYYTGLRIQGILNVSKVTGVDAEQAATRNFEESRSNAQLISISATEQAGDFQRRQLETIKLLRINGAEKPFHVIYSFYWNKNADMIAGTTFSAPEEEWGEAEKVWNIMKDFKLVDIGIINPPIKLRVHNPPKTIDFH